MISEKEIEKLADLSRIAISVEEKESLRKSMDSILNYVEQVQRVSKGLDSGKKAGLLRNVMRGDDQSHESGIFTEVLLSAAPKRDGQYLKVKKIL